MLHCKSETKKPQIAPCGFKSFFAPCNIKKCCCNKIQDDFNVAYGLQLIFLQTNKAFSCASNTAFAFMCDKNVTYCKMYLFDCSEFFILQLKFLQGSFI